MDQCQKLIACLPRHASSVTLSHFKAREARNWHPVRVVVRRTNSLAP